MPLLSPALRFEVLKALERAQEDVARGHPSLQVSFHYMRLTARARIEVDRALDDVRFEVPPEQLEAVALSQGDQSAEGLRLRERLKSAQQNAAIPWVSPEGLSRVQTIALAFIAAEFVKRIPTSAGAEQPGLPLYLRSH